MSEAFGEKRRSVNVFFVANSKQTLILIYFCNKNKCVEKERVSINQNIILKENCGKHTLEK